MAQAIIVRRGGGSGKTSILNATVTLGTPFTYNGSAQTQTIASVVLNGVTLTENEDFTVSGNTATNAGAHSITLTGINNFEGTKTVPWTIAKATGAVSLNPATLTLGASGLTGTIDVTRSGDGAISISGYNSAVISASVIGTNISVSCLSDVAANTTITVNVAASANYLATSATCAVTIQYLPVQDTLDNTSWEDINTIAAAGLASDYWEVGDTKTITFDSAVLGSPSVQVEILDFDYDDLADGSGKAKISFGMVDMFVTTQPMSATLSNSCGWENSPVRNTIANTLLPAFESVIGANIIKDVSKRTSAGNEASTVTTTTDSLWLMSEYEVTGGTEKSVAGEKPVDKNICYSAFTDSASRIKNCDGAVYFWWTRSPLKTDNSGFAIMYSDGTVRQSSANNSRGISIGFCV